MNLDEIKIDMETMRIAALVRAPWVGADDFRLVILGEVETIVQRRSDRACHFEGVSPYWQ